MKRKLLLLLTSSLVTLLVLEGLIRIFLPQSDRFYQPDPALGSKLRPNFTGRWYGKTNFHREFKNTVTTNNQGFHDLDHTTKNSLGTNRLVILGDSFVEALQVPLSQTVARKLEQNLNQTQEWEVIALSRAGISTAEEIVLWENYGQKYHPQVVVIVFSKNDLLGNEGLTPTTFDRPRFFLANDYLYRAPVIFSPPPSQILETLSEISHLARFIHRFKLHESAKAATAAETAATEFSTLNPQLSFRLMQLLITQIKQSTARPLVAFIYDDKETREKLSSITSFLQAEEVDYFFVGNKSDPQNQGLFFIYDGHLNSAGHEMLAQKIADYVVRLKL